MSAANIVSLASLVVARETHFPWILAKLAIFATDMLWESCSKFYSEHFSHNMFCQNIVSLVIIKIMNLYIRLGTITLDLSDRLPGLGSIMK